MSLIQEALQRQQQESGEGELKDGAPPLQRPMTDTEKPPPKNNTAPESQNQEPEPPKKSGSPPPLKKQAPQKSGNQAGKIIILALLLAGIGIFAWYQLKPKRQAPDPSTSVTPAETPDPVETVASPVTKPDTPVPMAETGTPPAPKSHPATETAAQPLTPEPLGGTEWPLFTLNGIVGSGAQGACQIDGDIFRVGDVVQGVKVLAIRKDGTELEYQGEKRFLRVGGSTYP